MIPDIQRINDIAKDKRIHPKIVRYYQDMDLGEALDRFLSPEINQGLIQDRKYFSDPQTRDEKLTNALFYIGTMHYYADEFCKTEQGRLWYESQFPDFARAASRVFSKRILRPIKGIKRRPLPKGYKIAV